MAPSLNLLHEEILEQRQRKRDPAQDRNPRARELRRTPFSLLRVDAYQTFEIKAKLSAITAIGKAEPQFTQAQKRSAALTDIINTTRRLDDTSTSVFSGTFLEKLSALRPPNAQLTAWRPGFGR